MDPDYVECYDCEDSGWRTVECDGEVLADGKTLCRRTRRHLPHEFVKQCECRPMNRRFQEKHQRARRVA